MAIKNLILITILLFLIVANVTNAVFLLNFRKLADESTKNNPNLTVPPIPSPVSEIDKGKDKNNQTIPPPTPEEKKPKEEQVKNVTPPVKPTTDTKKDDSPKEEVKEQDTDTSKVNGKEDNTNPKEEVKEKQKGEKKATESCDGMERRCNDRKSMVACVTSIDDGSKVVALVIQNKGESSLKVDLEFSSSENKQKLVEIPKLQTKQVNVPLAKVGSNEIKLNAGNGYCVLHLDQTAPFFQFDIDQWYPSYSKLMTPMYAAYLILSITLVAGGVCACCWFTKRKRTNDAPYQELEMSVPESATDMDTAEGWDDNWDDDWDEEKAVKSPGHSISANGLTSRTPKKDGWEDWDD